MWQHLPCQSTMSKQRSWAFTTQIFRFMNYSIYRMVPRTISSQQQKDRLSGQTCISLTVGSWGSWRKSLMAKVTSAPSGVDVQTSKLRKEKTIMWTVTWNSPIFNRNKPLFIPPPPFFFNYFFCASNIHIFNWPLYTNSFYVFSKLLNIWCTLISVCMIIPPSFQFVGQIVWNVF